MCARSVVSAVLAPVGALPWLVGFASPVYGALSVAGGLAMVWYAWRVYRVREGEEARKAAMSLFGVSILYLFTLFIAIVVENGAAGALARAASWLLT